MFFSRCLNRQRRQEEKKIKEKALHEMCGGCVGVPAHICMLANQKSHQRTKAKSQENNKPGQIVVVVEQLANQSDKAEECPYEELTGQDYHNHTFGGLIPLLILALLG